MRNTRTRSDTHLPPRKRARTRRRLATLTESGDEEVHDGTRSPERAWSGDDGSDSASAGAGDSASDSDSGIEDFIVSDSTSEGSDAESGASACIDLTRQGAGFATGLGAPEPAGAWVVRALRGVPADAARMETELDALCFLGRGGPESEVRTAAWRAAADFNTVHLVPMSPREGVCWACGNARVLRFAATFPNGASRMMDAASSRVGRNCADVLRARRAARAWINDMRACVTHPDWTRYMPVGALSAAWERIMSAGRDAAAWEEPRL